jgi:hypothetical protein
MTTTLAVYNSEGCVGRCDANCHDATSPHCDCICGGKNHGQGLQKAIENNHELIGLTPEDLKKFAEAHGLDADKLVAIDRIRNKQSRAHKLAKRALSSSDPGFFKCHGVISTHEPKVYDFSDEP